VLSDDDLQHLAEAHLRTHYSAATVGTGASPGLMLDRAFALDDPPGVCFTVRVDPEVGILLGGHGFFIYREDGTIRTFGSGEVPYTTTITPSVIRHFLTHPADDQQTDLGLGALLTRKRRRWWRFWE
jgi:hypothetical protein